MLDYSQTRAPCDFYLPTFFTLPFPGLTSLPAQLHPDRPWFICLHGSETQQLQFPRLHRLSVKKPDLSYNFLPTTSRDAEPLEPSCSPGAATECGPGGAG